MKRGRKEEKRRKTSDFFSIVRTTRVPKTRFFQSLIKRRPLNLSKSFFVPSFLDAVSNTSEENFKSIIVRAAPGIYTFDMFKPQFCQMLIAEVDALQVGIAVIVMFATKLNGYNIDCF
ncbi:hypothetical protein YC2023_050680 [Brassica napus]